MALSQPDLLRLLESLRSADGLERPVRGRGLQRHVVEALRAEPRVVRRPPRDPAAPHEPLAQQQFAHPMASTHQISAHILAGRHQISGSFFGRRRHPHRGELVQTQQLRQVQSVACIGLHPLTGRTPQSGGREPLAAYPRCPQRPGQIEAGRPGFVGHRGWTGQASDPPQDFSMLRREPTADQFPVTVSIPHATTLGACTSNPTLVRSENTGPPPNVGTTGQAAPGRQLTTTCERGPGSQPAPTHIPSG
ncbi:hypothetical protein QFZ32_009219 [Streptomyces canus]|nr:hypothetical protein [Streptomyces canus]